MLHGLRDRLRRWKWRLTGSFVAAGILVLTAPVYAIASTRGKLYTVKSVSKHDVAIVFGAGIVAGRPTPYLKGRLDAAVQLYREGKVRVMLMSGDNSKSWYDEPTTMKRYVVAHGVPPQSVVLDYAGFDTYDTCYRAHALFGIKSAILVSHDYHLPRALMTCNHLGISSDGVPADQTPGGYSKTYLAREVFSLDRAALQLSIHAKPTLLGPKVPGISIALGRNQK